MKSSQKNAKPSIRQAMLLGGSLVLAGAAQAGMVTDQHGNVGYDVGPAKFTATSNPAIHSGFCAPAWP